MFPGKISNKISGILYSWIHVELNFYCFIRFKDNLVRSDYVRLWRSCFDLEIIRGKPTQVNRKKNFQNEKLFIFDKNGLEMKNVEN